ncbi:MAG: CBS domain-containing protein [Anaerolineaceae bacterium]|nr:MAG: CBS domain-containing protein [Anaerolineaceae bacterium]
MLYVIVVTLVFLLSIGVLLYNQKHKKFRFAEVSFMKTCNEVMTKTPVCCLPNDTVAKAAELMKSGNVGSIPVIDNEQTRKLVGIVTDRDLALMIVAEGRDAKSTKVDAVMTRKVVACHADDVLQKALDAMSEHQLRRIPVVDNDNKILGIIAQADVATRVNQPEKTATMVKEISRSDAK